MEACTWKCSASLRRRPAIVDESLFISPVWSQNRTFSNKSLLRSMNTHSSVDVSRFENPLARRLPAARPEVHKKQSLHHVSIMSRPVVSVASVVLNLVPPTSRTTTGLVLNSLTAAALACTAIINITHHLTTSLLATPAADALVPWCTPPLCCCVLPCCCCCPSAGTFPMGTSAAGDGSDGSSLSSITSLGRRDMAAVAVGQDQSIEI